MKNNENNNDLIFDNSTKQFIQLINNYNKITKKPLKQISTYDKIHNYFNKISFHKLSLLGEDLNNYGSVIVGGVVHSPKSIKIDYFGDERKQKEFSIQKNDQKNYKNHKLILKTEINQNISENENDPKNLKEIKPIKIFQNQNSLSNNISLPLIKSFIPTKKKKTSRNNQNIENKESENARFRSRSFDKSSGELPKLIYANDGKYKVNSNIKNTNDDKEKEISLKILELKKKLGILEKRAKIENSLIENSNKENEEGKPQFKLRFKYLNSMFNDY